MGKSNRKLKEINVYPSINPVVIEGESNPFTVVSSYDDGYSEDITRLSKIVFANTEVAELSNDSMYVKGKKGETKVKVTYEGLTIEG